MKLAKTGNLRRWTTGQDVTFLRWFDSDFSSRLFVNEWNGNLYFYTSWWIVPASRVERVFHFFNLEIVPGTYTLHTDEGLRRNPDVDPPVLGQILNPPNTDPKAHNVTPWPSILGNPIVAWIQGEEHVPVDVPGGSAKTAVSPIKYRWVEWICGPEHPSDVRFATRDNLHPVHIAAVRKDDEDDLIWHGLMMPVRIP